VDLEFVQFHPTVLNVPGVPRFLLSEALRGEGGRLVNGVGEPFMTRYEPAGDLAPRDRVSRAMVKEIERTGSPVYLSMAHLDGASVRARFPTITEACRVAGLDLGTDRIPVSPAAHYLMGGVQTDLDGRTSIDGLLAAGEVACTGVHGANRLASNSLLEGLVFGARAAAAMTAASAAARVEEPAMTWTPGGRAAAERPSEAAVRDLMWRHVGLLRHRDGLRQAVGQLETWTSACERTPGFEDPAAIRLGSLIVVGLMIARAAERREESRGGHFRTDFPERDDLHWGRHVADRWTV
jgi:L-aspartate oxidase